MSAGRVFGVLQRVLVAVVLVVSGAYLLVYLYRWEWNRALISGLFFVAAEVALATSMVLRRLHALERPSPLVQERLRTARVDRPDPFAWLRPRDGRAAVFVPVLLGAGVVLSALAYLVERLAAATATPMLDHSVAGRLARIAPPVGGLVGGPAPRVEAPHVARRTVNAVVRGAVVVTSVAVLGGLAVLTLMDATQSRPDPTARPLRTVIDVEIAERGSAAPAAETLEALWTACRATTGRSDRPEGVAVPLGGDTARLLLNPGLGDLGVRRLTGCLSDATLSLVRARVLRVEGITARP